jgi:hypothetical protein
VDEGRLINRIEPSVVSNFLLVPNPWPVVADAHPLAEH